ncbi:MAG TPA: choice-of-anchor tandem repeat GloVer-containing protein [Rhizomicrobium sp.]
MFRTNGLTSTGIFGGALMLATFLPLAGAQAASSEKVLYEFKGQSDGDFPSGVLIADGAGNFYGTAGYGGDLSCKNNNRNGSGCGVIFKLTPTGTESVLHAFTGLPDGSGPAGGLIADSAGNFYGTTANGGIGEESFCKTGCGTVFRLTPGGKEKVLYAFTAGTDGYGPVGGVIVDSAGNLYGTTIDGGSNEHCGSDSFGCGTVFKLTAGGTESLLHVFMGGSQSDGAFPAGRLISDSSGNLYGTTGAGGSTDSCGTAWEGCGTVFKLTPDGTETLLHAFAGGSDGAYPAGALIEDGSGNLYGTTVAGGSSDNCGEGAHGCGTVFKISSNGTETILHAFAGGSDGAYPLGALFTDSAGNLYGETGAGGSTKTCKLGLLPKASGCGTVFEISSTGTETVLHVFKGSKASDGAYPGAGLIADSAGNLYGSTAGGGVAGCAGGIGTVGCGIVFKLKE